MSNHDRHMNGFSLAELMVVLALTALFATTFATLFNSTFFGYLDLQKQAASSTQMSIQSARISDVLRGLMSIELAKDDELTVYAYFYPSDAYVSRIRYYIVTNGAYKQLRADLTPMTSNPPLGQLQNDKIKTYTLIENYYNRPGTKLFVYYNGGNNPLPTPVNDFGAIKSIGVQLSAKNDRHADEQIIIQVTLRNRKTNL